MRGDGFGMNTAVNTPMLEDNPGYVRFVESMLTQPS